MENNESLDSLISGNLDGATNQETVIRLEQNSTPPKLKKIKRLKVRPQMVSPEIPPKSEPDDLGNLLTDVTDNVLSSETSEQTSPTNISKENVEKSTDLVKYSDSQDVSSDNLDNLYDSNALPPDLDYFEDTDGYVDTSSYIKKSVFYFSTLACLFIGLFLGKMFFSSQVIEHHGLEGVVTNPDVPQGRPRCGLTDNSQACILYIMNWYRQELNGRDFYKLAAQLTGREEYMIDTDNLRYSNVKIKAGQIAQLNIPALK